MNVLETLKKTAWGAQTIAEWFGAGGCPEPLEIAEERSKICETCPQNTSPNWWAKNFTDPIAKVIIRHLEARQNLGLKLSNDDKMGMCAGCGCCLKLKPFVPIGHIIHHTDAQTMLKYPAHCWVKKEITP